MVSILAKGGNNPILDPNFLIRIDCKYFNRKLQKLINNYIKVLIKEICKTLSL